MFVGGKIGDGGMRIIKMHNMFPCYHYVKKMKSSLCSFLQFFFCCQKQWEKVKVQKGFLLNRWKMGTGGNGGWRNSSRKEKNYYEKSEIALHPKEMFFQ